jgi:hypothetical protein
LPSLPSPSCESPSSQSLLLRDALCGLGEYNFPAVVLVLLLRGFPEYGRLTNPMSYASLHCVPYKSFPTLSEPTVTKHSNDFITVFTSLPSVHVLHYNLFSTYVFLLLLPLFSSYTNLRFGTYILILKNVLTDSSVGIGWNSPKTYVPRTMASSIYLSGSASIVTSLDFFSCRGPPSRVLFVTATARRPSMGTRERTSWSVHSPPLSDLDTSF